MVIFVILGAPTVRMGAFLVFGGFLGARWFEGRETSQTRPAHQDTFLVYGAGVRLHKAHTYSLLCVYAATCRIVTCAPRKHTG